MNPDEGSEGRPVERGEGPPPINEGSDSEPQRLGERGEDPSLGSQPFPGGRLGVDGGGSGREEMGGSPNDEAGPPLDGTIETFTAADEDMASIRSLGMSLEQVPETIFIRDDIQKLIGELLAVVAETKEAIQAIGASARNTRDDGRGEIGDGNDVDFNGSGNDGGGKSGKSSFGDYSSPNRGGKSGKGSASDFSSSDGGGKSGKSSFGDHSSSGERPAEGCKRKRTTRKSSGSGTKRPNTRAASSDAPVNGNEGRNRSDEAMKRNATFFDVALDRNLSSLPDVADENLSVEELADLLRGMLDRDEIVDLEGFPLTEYVKRKFRAVLDKSSGMNRGKLMLMLILAGQKAPRYCRVCKKAGQKESLDDHDCPYCKDCFKERRGACVRKEECNDHYCRQCFVERQVLVRLEDCNVDHGA